VKCSACMGTVFPFIWFVRHNARILISPSCFAKQIIPYRYSGKKSKNFKKRLPIDDWRFTVYESGKLRRANSP
jgi:hypothetical protein